eukprot:6049482-Karenia_brevis.AAC.1
MVNDEIRDENVEAWGRSQNEDKVEQRTSEEASGSTQAPRLVVDDAEVEAGMPDDEIEMEVDPEKWKRFVEKRGLKIKDGKWTREEKEVPVPPLPNRDGAEEGMEESRRAR